jgi:hypothetical protein
MTRESYTIHITQVDDDPQFNSSGVAYIVGIADSGVIIGDGQAASKEVAIREAIQEAGLNND